MSRHSRPTQVYVMRGLDTGLLKIGRSENPRERTHGVASTTEAVELIAAYPAGPHVETVLHRRFAAHLVPSRGREWFRPTAELMAWVESIPSESRLSYSVRTKRRHPHLTPEQMDKRRQLPAEEVWSPDADRYNFQHRHFFVPGEYAEACRHCAALAKGGRPAPETAAEALRASRAA